MYGRLGILADVSSEVVYLDCYPLLLTLAWASLFSESRTKAEGATGEPVYTHTRPCAKWAKL